MPLLRATITPRGRNIRVVEQDTSHQHSTVEPFFFTQRLPPLLKYENFKSRLWTVVSVCIATNDAVLIWPWSSRMYLNSVRSSFISAQTVLQGRAPWHGPVACVPGQIHSSMVRPPYLSTARVPRPPVSCPPSQRQHPLARWSERLDLIWLLIAAKCGLLKVPSKTKKTKSKSHK